MVVTHKLKLDLLNWVPSEPIDVMQDDKYCRDIQIYLLANGIPYCPPEGCHALIRYSKADHTGGAYDILPDGTSAWEIAENVVTIRLAPQVCTKDGPVKIVVTLLQGKSELNCFEVALHVWKNPKAVFSSGKYVNITGFIPQPVSAAVGQYLEVAAVDRHGRITALQAVDAPEDSGPAEVELPENMVTADLSGAEETESDAVPVNADTLGGFLPGEYLRHGAITATLQQDMGALTADTLLPLTTLHAAGTVFEIEDGGIRCLFDGYVLASGAVFYQAGTANQYVGLQLLKNGAVQAEHYEAQPLGYGTVTMGARLIPVARGDVITLKACTTTGTVNADEGTMVTLVRL